MIKAVFFDWFSTLVEYDPPRPKLHVEACREYGIELPVEAVPRAIAVADAYFYDENARSAVANRSAEEKQKFFTEYETILLETAGIAAPPEVALRIIRRVRQFPTKLMVFDDVVPALQDVKWREVNIGLITNMHRDLSSLLESVGIRSYFDFLVTSQEVGAEKPHPEIFRAALRMAGIAPAEAMHVGDQYKADAMGACAVGINGVLLDRQGFFPDVTECPRIRSLAEVAGML
ncbi:MAG: HAD family hydrolase [Chloroflexi bacterium]|nr:HAD family hydrolase [Chloroflexota bacterium]